MRSAFFAAGLAALSAIATAIPTISTKGSYFFTSEGARWFVKGVAYQLNIGDPLVDTAQCTRDAVLMKILGANAIRVYHVDASSDHSGCMGVFADAGIYLFVDLDTYTTWITEVSPMWNSTQESAFEAVMDEFQQYDNTAGFFVGNEVLTNGSFSESAAYVKAATRDMKAYRESKGYRSIPIGYSHADISSLRPNLQNYLACGSNTNDSIDFFGLNSYEWCGTTSSYSISGYDTLTTQVMNYPIPIFFSETGCNSPEPRTFEDQTAIFGSAMNPYWSGAIIYEWIQEVNHFGLITYGDDTNALVSTLDPNSVTRSGTPTPITPDFSNLMAQWATATPTGVSEAAYNPTHSAPACPAYTVSTWEIDGNIALPTLNEAYNSVVQYSISAGSLPTGVTSQSAASTTGTATGAVTGTASASATAKGAAGRSVSTVGQELFWMGAGLGGVMLGFIWWL